ncbi:hypothetical protein [Pumilibacter muris]|uniref:hypothetical protein n=1 Tax=Pumilibacter muris TaxID=2941510 RepID=UPI00203D636A|nr:hypothetical protein [Pumilibacter muris]
MRKRVVALILGILMSCSLFAGCSLIEHNDDKDARQVIAVINSIEDTSNGVKYTSETKYIYKSDLIRSMNTYAQQYMTNYNLSLKQAAERLLDELITRELLLIEADRIEKQGLIEWTQKDTNEQIRNIYSTVDSQLQTIRKEILGDYDESAPSDDEEESSSTTYPVPETEKDEDDKSDYELDKFGNIQYTVKKDKDGNVVQEQAVDSNGYPMYEKKKDEDGNEVDDLTKPIMVDVMVPVYKNWYEELKKDESKWPGTRGTEEQKSLDREAVRRFVSLIKELADSDIKATKEDKKKFADDLKKINDVIGNKGAEYVYPMLGETYIMEYLVGESAHQSILINKLRDYIVGDVEVTDEEVVDAYTKQLTYQVETFTNDQSAYQTALSEGNTTMLYMRDDSYFYVKHILLPFSEKQTAALTAYKNDPKNAGKDYRIMRDTQMVNETVVYAHVNGENDLSNPKTVNEVFDEIYGAMALVASNPKEAERKFDELTYKYNTDTGAFGYGKAYAVKRNDDEGHSGYMEEFYDGAIKLYDEHKVGEVLPEIVVTDYGVHIMYFSQAVVPGTIRTLNDYLTPGAYKTVRESFAEVIRSTKENNAFTSWQNERITYYREKPGTVKTYEKRYKSLYED